MSVFDIPLSDSLKFEYSHLLIDFDNPSALIKTESATNNLLFSALPVRNETHLTTTVKLRAGDENAPPMLTYYSELMFSELLTKSKPLKDRFQKISSHFDDTLKKFKEVTEKFDTSVQATAQQYEGKTSPHFRIRTLKKAQFHLLLKNHCKFLNIEPCTILFSDDNDANYVVATISGSILSALTNLQLHRLRSLADL